MAKRQYAKSRANRGEDIGEPNGLKYDHAKNQAYKEHTINRHEIRDRYAQMFQSEQRRDQRAFARVMDPYNEFFAGVDPRRKIEIADAGMIQEDQRQVANLSDRFIQCEFPKAPYYVSQYIANTINKVDLINDVEDL